MLSTGCCIRLVLLDGYRLPFISRTSLFHLCGLELFEEKSRINLPLLLFFLYDSSLPLQSLSRVRACVRV